MGKCLAEWAGVWTHSCMDRWVDGQRNGQDVLARKWVGRRVEGYVWVSE